MNAYAPSALLYHLLAGELAVKMYPLNHVWRRAWAANGKDALIGHFLMHAEPAIVKDLWRIYQDGPPADQEYELGTHVRVLFDDGLWYAGVVACFNTVTSKYSVQFDDGDEMDLRIPDKDVEIVAQDGLETASQKRPTDDSTGGGRKACQRNDDDGIMLGSNAYRYQKSACTAAAQPSGAIDAVESVPDDEATRLQREAEEAARAAAESRRRELAAQQRSTFVATAFRAPGPKKAAHSARKLGKKKKLGGVAKNGKSGMQKKYKMKNKSFK